MIWLKRLVCIGVICVGPSVQAEQRLSCLPNFTAMQYMTEIDPKAELDRSIFLMNENGSGARIASRVQFRIVGIDSEDSRALQPSLRFDPEFDGVSLPYNLFAIQILLNGQVYAWWDYTQSCTGSGLSFFPGREIRLPTVKLIGDKLQKLQIMVWGKI